MHVSMVFFERGKATLATAAAALRGAGLAITERGDRIEVVGDPNTGPWFDVVLSERKHVAVEAREIGGRGEFAAALAKCDARFEIEIGDLAGTLDETNTLIQTQLALLALTGGVQFNSWNGGLTALK